MKKRAFITQIQAIGYRTTSDTNIFEEPETGIVVEIIESGAKAEIRKINHHKHTEQFIFSGIPIERECEVIGRITFTP